MIIGTTGFKEADWGREVGGFARADITHNPSHGIARRVDWTVGRPIRRWTLLKERDRDQHSGVTLRKNTGVGEKVDIQPRRCLFSSGLGPPSVIGGEAGSDHRTK